MRSCLLFWRQWFGSFSAGAQHILRCTSHLSSLLALPLSCTGIVRHVSQYFAAGDHIPISTCKVFHGCATRRVTCLNRGMWWTHVCRECTGFAAGLAALYFHTAFKQAFGHSDNCVPGTQACHVCCVCMVRQWCEVLEKVRMCNAPPLQCKDIRLFPWVA